MTDPQPNPDPTIRHGQVNVPHSTTPTHPPRHQPDTPINKKFATTTSQPTPRRRKPKPTTTDTPDPPPGENNNVSTPPG